MKAKTLAAMLLVGLMIGSAIAFAPETEAGGQPRPSENVLWLHTALNADVVSYFWMNVDASDSGDE
ncbi:MAG: hypothetical protein CVT47_04375, partial [Thermoplasmata archaeon HGW-Thermoplasmata-2]